MIFGRKAKPKPVVNPAQSKGSLKPLSTKTETTNHPVMNEAFSKDNLIHKETSQWSATEVGQWLTSLGMDEYRIQFLENGITGEELLDLSEKDLQSLGVKRLGDRKSLLKRIENLKTKKPFDEDSGSTASEDSLDDVNSMGSGSVTSLHLDDIQIKCYLPNGEIRIIDTPSLTSISDLKKKILTEFKSEYVVKYKDEDGDMILLHSDNDIRRAVKNGLMKVYLVPLNDLTPQECEALEQMVDGSVVIDKKGNIQFMNRSGLRLFGYGKEDVLGKNVRILMTKNDSKSHPEYMKNYLETGFARIIGKGRVVQCLRSDGNSFAARLCVTEKKDTSGRHIFTGTFSEIEDQETVNLSSVVNTWTVFDAALDPTVVINDTGIILFFNKAAEKLFGYQKNEVQNTNVKILMPQPFRDQHDKFLSNYNKSGISKIVGTGRELPVQLKDGSIKRAVLKLSKQEISGMVFFVGVLAEQAPAPLQKSKSLLEQERDIIGNLLLPAVVIDSSGIIQAWNSAAEQLLGYSVVEVIGRNINFIMLGSEKENHDSYLKRYLTTGNSKIIGRGRKVNAQTAKGEVISVNLWVSEKSENSKKIFTGILQTA